MIWNPLRAARQRRQEEQERFLTALTTITSAQASALEKVAEAILAQSKSTQAHLDLFKVPAPPASRVIRDWDEYQKELERMKLNESEQLEWVLTATDDPAN